VHKNSIRIMKYFIRKYVGDKNQIVLDIGSRVVNSRRLGCYRNLFENDLCKYIGIDIINGENVDMVVSDNKFPFKDGEVDVVVSGSTFEHVEYPWELIKEMTRVLKKGGLCCIVVPYSGGEHKIPFDTYRYFPDGMIALAKWAGLNVLKVGILKEDTYLIAKK